MRIDIYKIAESFNYIEILLWGIFGIAMILQSKKVDKAYKKILYVLAMTFFTFSLSDYIEIQTGAWWTPWWLFLLKAICVIIFIYSKHEWVPNNKFSTCL